MAYKFEDVSSTDRAAVRLISKRSRKTMTAGEDLLPPPPPSKMEWRSLENHLGAMAEKDPFQYTDF